MIDVGKGYRLLEPREEVLRGDQYYSHREGGWFPSVKIGTRIRKGQIYRRPISQEKTEDAE